MCSNKKMIGKNIKRVVKNKGMNLVDLAKKLGISKQRLSYNINEKEDKNWVMWEIRHYCEVLGVKEEVLLRGVDLHGILGAKIKD